MAGSAGILDGKRILVAEDEYLLADDLIQVLRSAGATPVGPVATVRQAEARLAEGGIDAALLDMNLRGETAFDLACRLTDEGVPCVIVSGYSEQALPPLIAGLPRLEKPINPRGVIRILEDMMG